MPKIILEREDIKKLIKAKYPGAEIVSGEITDITIRVDDFHQAPAPAPKKQEGLSTPPDPDGDYDSTKYFKTHDGKLVEIPEEHKPRPIVVDGDSIDAKASGLTLEPRKKTTPGGPMGRERGRMKTF